MNPHKVVVYAGPTISSDGIRALVPRAQVRRPAARGDLLAEQWQPGDVAVLIDGFFRERRSVGHKEILWLLGQGVDVVGTASMGALRAAEMGPCGMRGLGVVHDMYATGEVDGDDEVGVVHGPAERGYPAQTVALVNLRYGVREGVRTGLFAASSGQRILVAAKELPFILRGWSDLEQAVGAEDHQALGVLRHRIDEGIWDRKRLDAVAALRAVAGRAVAEPASPAPAGVVVTGIGRSQLLARQSRHEYAPGRWMTDLDVLDAARLFAEDYPVIHEQVLTGLLSDLAAEQGLDLPGYVRDRLGIDDAVLPDDLAVWLTEPELARTAPADRLRLIMVRVWPTWQSVDWRPAVLARLRASRGWSDWSDIVVQAAQVAEETRYRLAVPPPALSAKIFLRHWRGNGTSPEIEMARRGFTGSADLGTAVGRFFAYDVQRARATAVAR